MYSTVLISSDKKEEKKEKAIDADDPANAEEVRKNLFG